MENFDNPFSDTVNSNPFSDSSVQQARSSGDGGGRSSAPKQQPAAATPMGEFNPFERKDGSPEGTAGQPPPSYASSAQQRGLTSDELERRQRELEAKARDLERREEEQRRRELEGGTGGPQRVNNWPPLPAACPVGPCFYQDFDLEIPAEYRQVVKAGYYLWIAHVCLLLVNILGCLTYFIVVQKTDAVTSGTVFGMSLLMCIILVPCTYICWFRPLYKAFKNDSSFNFFFFFGVFAVQVCVLVVQCLGINYLGSVGWINAGATLKNNVGAGAFMMIIAALFTLLVVADIVLFIKVHRIYRTTGASFAKARQEMGRDVATNETVRGAAASSLSAAMSGGGGNSSGGRF